MDLNVLSDADVAISTQALSVHRRSLRNKLERLRPGSTDYKRTLSELRETTAALSKLAAEDLKRVNAA